jgi:hypothetical protein
MITPRTRRQFLAAATQAVAGLTLTGCASALRAAPGRTATVTDGLTVIDTHTHFYDPSRPEGVPWPPPNEKRLYRTTLPKDYLALPVPRPVAGTVVVEASPWVEDNQWVLDLAAKEPFIVGLVGNLPVGTKPFAGHLKSFLPKNDGHCPQCRIREIYNEEYDACFGPVCNHWLDEGCGDPACSCCSNRPAKPLAASPRPKTQAAPRKNAKRMPKIRLPKSLVHVAEIVTKLCS